MIYQIVYSKKFAKNIKEIPQQYQANIRVRVNDLARNPRPSVCKKLVGATDLYRIRIGVYRVIYQIVDNELLIVAINVDHRSRIYENH